MSLSEDIKDYGLGLGYSRVGITTADGFPEYRKELEARSDQYSFYTESGIKPLEWTEPRNVMPSAKSLVVAIYDCSNVAYPEKFIGKVGRHYLARSYIAPRHMINGARRQLLRDFLEKSGLEVKVARGIPERLASARAGIAGYGRNTFVFAGDIGSFMLAITFLVDAELEYGTPDWSIDCPPKCTACIDACPTGALYEPMRMNPRRCIAYNCFTTMDGYPGGCTSYIPPDIREKMGTWIHGCDICESICPRNQKRLKAKLLPDPFLEKIAEGFDLARILNLTDEYYNWVIYPIMYNYIREKKYFQRNAAIALGNTGDTAYVPDLAQAMEDPEDLVRAYAAWALGRIGGEKAKQVLEKSLKREPSELAKKEIETSLGAEEKSVASL